MYNGGRIGLYKYENDGFLVSYTMDGCGTMELVSIIDDEICYVDEWEITGSSDLNSYEAIESVENNYNSIKNAISKAIAEYESDSMNVKFSGKCGDSAYYTIKDGVLDITGTGEINIYYDELPGVKNPDIIERIIIHDGINWISNDHMFSGLNSLTYVSVPDTLEYIGQGAFAMCEKLEELEIPEGIEAIGDGCFEDCYNLKKLILPKSLESIDVAGLLYSFKNCDNLIIYGYSNTYAESYSKEKGIPFVILDDSYDDANSITVTLNDEKIAFDQSPIIQNDRTLVPMRAIFEAMGCDVYRDGDNQSVEVWRGEENVMMLWIGDNEMWTPKEYYYRNQSDIVNFGCFLNDNPHHAGDFGYAFYNYTYDSDSNIEFCLGAYFNAMENEGYSVEYVKNKNGGDFYQIVGNGYEIDVINDYLLEHIEIRIFE